MRLVLRGSVAVVVTLWLATAAAAAPIAVSAGETVVFNFDFVAAGVSPAPPYASMAFFTNLDLSTFDPFDAGSWGIFPELGGGGTQIFPGTPNLVSIGPNADPGWIDGIFSAVLSMTAGSITVDPSAIGFAVTGAPTPSVPFQQPQPGAVPEPATLTLLGVGLVGTAVWRHKIAAR